MEKIIISGNELLLLPKNQLISYAKQIYEALALHTETMIQYTDEQIINNIISGHSIIVISPHTKQCLAFSQLHIWYADLKKQRPGAIEIRSWLSWEKGCGKLAIEGAKKLSTNLFPFVPIYAIVAETNENAKKKLLGYTGTIVPRPSCIGHDLRKKKRPIATIAINLSIILHDD